MSGTHYYVKDSANGDMVAKAIGVFVNSYVHPTEKFYEHMLLTGKNVRHNFTMLCMEWFKSLAEMQDVDERNRASVQTAGLIADEIKYDSLARQKMGKNGILPECYFDYQNDADAVRLFEKYLRLSEDNSAFIHSMLYYVHKTNQQSFSRLCMTWIQKVAELPGKRVRYVILARKAAKHYVRFPLI